MPAATRRRRRADHDGAAALIWVGEADEARLRAANRANVPIVAVTDAPTVPYVLADDLVRIPPGQGFPVDLIAAAVARRLDDDAVSLAARLPVLRPAVTDRLIAAASRRNALIGVAAFMPGIEMQILTFNQLRIVLPIALAHGECLDRARALELVGVVGLLHVPGDRPQPARLRPGGRYVNAIAYTGTRASVRRPRYFIALR